MTKSLKSTRRNFLKLAGLAGLGALTTFGISRRENFKSTPITKLVRKTQHSRYALGTRVSIAAIHDSQSLAENAIGAAYEDLDAMEKIFTRFSADSHVCELNKTRTLAHLPDEMLSVLEACQYFHRDTKGAFDITVQPILDLFAKSYERGKEPSEADIQSILPSIGADKLQVRGRSLYLSAEGMALSFDGVVPGYIADRAARILEGYGIKRYLVDAGGELRASGNGPSGGAWRVAVQDPKKEQNYPAVISLDRGAVSTSGSYESFYSDNGDFHHIVNAKTGRSPAQTTSVTVLAPTAIEADILSTALFVMPITEGLAYINARPQYSCLIIEKDGALFKSDNFAFS